MQVLNDVWLTWWTEHEFDLPDWQYPLFYILTSMLYAISTFLTSLIWAFVGIFGSRNIHRALLRYAQQAIDGRAHVWTRGRGYHCV
jgi:hypothetical protein|eukprot:COSAG01_NODE_810_length_13426_cov_7.873790_9_plen_86_part_00